MKSPIQIRDLTSDEIETYDKEGVVCLRGLFSARWIELMRKAAERGLNDPGELHAELAAEHGDDGRFFHDTFVWTRNENCRQFVFESPAANIAAQLMQSARINIFFDPWPTKEPGTTTRTPCHQDMPS